MRALLIATTAILLFGTACKGNCRQLSEKLCECANNLEEKANCLRLAAKHEEEASKAGALTPAAEQRCAQLLPTCDCRQLDTAEGKVRCGFARPPP